MRTMYQGGLELRVWRLRIVVLIIAVLWKIFFGFISGRVAPGTIMQGAARCWLVLYLRVHRYLLALIPPYTGCPPETLVRVEMRLMHGHSLLLLLLLLQLNEISRVNLGKITYLSATMASLSSL